jgi:hypothetical protein
MTTNHRNEKYKSVFQDIPFEAKRLNGTAFVFGNGRPMRSHNVRLHPVFRNPPDLERVGRALIEMAVEKDSDQKSAAK